MIRFLLQRHALAVCVLVYMGILIALHVLGLFPRPDLYDLSRLIGAPQVILEGEVVDFPVIRWNQTRFLMEGRARPLEAFRGRAVVTLAFPWPELTPGDVIGARGWLSAPREPSWRRPFDERRYWRSQRVFSLFKVWSPESVLVWKSPKGHRFQRAAWRFYNRFQAFWKRVLPPDEAALLLGITIGARGILPASLKEDCIRAGVYHIVVVSGQNVALIIGLAMTLLKILQVPRRWGVWICATPVVFYACVVGSGPPVVRAAAMALVGLAAAALGRDVPPYYPLLLAAGWIVVQAPETLLGASFQLSFVATASLLWTFSFTDRLWALWPRALRGLMEAGVLCLTVQIGVCPLLVFYFHRFSWVGLFANWMVFPLASVIMVLGLGLGTWGIFSPESVPALMIELIEKVVQLTLKIIAGMSVSPGAAFPVAPPPAWVVWLYYACLFGILLIIHRRKKAHV